MNPMAYVPEILTEAASVAALPAHAVEEVSFSYCTLPINVVTTA